MSNHFPDTEPDLSYILQTDLLETPELTIKVVKEIPVDGIDYQESYSDPCLIVNLGAQLKTFEVIGDRTQGYRGAVIPGDFSFLPPGSILEGYYKGNFLYYAYIMFARERFNPRFSDRLRIMKSDRLIQRFARALYFQSHRNDPDIVLYRDSISQALIQHLQLIHLDTNNADFKQKPDLDRLESYVRANLSAKLTVAELASLEETTAKLLQRTVRTQYGLSVYQWITKIRLERSLKLLRDSKLDLATIAIETGFANQSHWTRLFRRQFGITPGKLRSQSARSY